jgi:peroxiredoxin
MAINPASVEAHDKYCERKGFSFPLLSDPDRIVADKFQALKTNGKSIQRLVYVVGPEGNIIFAEEGMPANQKMIDVIQHAHV